MGVSNESSLGLKYQNLINNDNFQKFYKHPFVIRLWDDPYDPFNGSSHNHPNEELKYPTASTVQQDIDLLHWHFRTNSRELIYVYEVLTDGTICHRNYNKKLLDIFKTRWFTYHQSTCRPSSTRDGAEIALRTLKTSYFVTRL